MMNAVRLVRSLKTEQLRTRLRDVEEERSALIALIRAARLQERRQAQTAQVKAVQRDR